MGCETIPTKLKDVCLKIGSGATPRGGKEAYFTSGISLIRSQNVLDFSFSYDGLAFINDEQAAQLNNVTIQENDVLINITGDSVARVCMVPKDVLPARVNQHVSIIRPNSRADSKYLLYFLQHEKPHLLSIGSSGGTRNALTKEMLENLELELPLIGVQKRISATLSSLDDKIELNKRIIANLEAQAQAIFKSWFVDFEPFQDRELEESELGLIPKGWQVINLGEIVSAISGYSYKGSDLNPSNVALVTIKNFNRNGGFKSEGYKEILDNERIKSQQFVDLFDIVVAHTDLTQKAEIIGNPIMILSKCSYEKLVASMDLVKVETKVPQLSNHLIYQILADSRFKDHSLGYVNGTTVLHLGKKAIAEYKIALPTNFMQIEGINRIFESLSKKKHQLIVESEKLIDLRYVLLPKLMSGEIEVPLEG